MTGSGGGNRIEEECEVAVVAREVIVDTEDFRTEKAFPDVVVGGGADVDSFGLSGSELAVDSLRFCFSAYSALTLSISDCGTLGEEGGGVELGVTEVEEGAGFANCTSCRLCISMIDSHRRRKRGTNVQQDPKRDYDIRKRSLSFLDSPNTT